MNGLAHFSIFSKYNARLNQQVFSAAAKLSDQALKQDRNAYFKSILATLNHILVGDLLWLRRFHQHSLNQDTCHFSQLDKLSAYPDITSLDQILFADFKQLKQARFAVDSIISRWINDELTEADLESGFDYQNMKGEISNKNFAEVLSHIFNHQTHHRGQASTLLMQAGVDIGVTDYLVDIN